MKKVWWFVMEARWSEMVGSLGCFSPGKDKIQGMGVLFWVCWSEKKGKMRVVWPDFAAGRDVEPGGAIALAWSQSKTEKKRRGLTSGVGW